MATYAVPVLLKIKAIVTVDADSPSEAKRLVREGDGHVECLASNSVAYVSHTDGATIRKGGVRLVDSALAELLRDWDNDSGVPW